MIRFDLRSNLPVRKGKKLEDILSAVCPKRHFELVSVRETDGD